MGGSLRSWVSGGGGGGGGGSIQLQTFGYGISFFADLSTFPNWPTLTQNVLSATVIIIVRTSYMDMEMQPVCKRIPTYSYLIALPAILFHALCKIFFKKQTVHSS